jgi:hypothetical protein
MSPDYKFVTNVIEPQRWLVLLFLVKSQFLKMFPVDDTNDGWEQE